MVPKINTLDLPVGVSGFPICLEVPCIQFLRVLAGIAAMGIYNSID
jgi:hypothetical protein